MFKKFIIATIIMVLCISCSVAIEKSCWDQFIADLKECNSEFGPHTNSNFDLPDSSFSLLHEGDPDGSPVALKACIDVAKEKWEKCTDTTVYIPYADVMVVRGTGKPETFTDSFQAAEGTYTITIKNGLDDKDRISSAVIKINGEKVVTPDMFNQNVDTIEVDVYLNNGLNDIGLQLRSKPESLIIFTFAITDVPIN